MNLLPFPVRVVIVGLLLCLGLTARANMDPENCLSCHGLQGFATMDADGEVHGFMIDADKWADTVHGRLACSQCHTDVDQIPHTWPVAEVTCTIACHLIDPYTGNDFSHRAMGDALAKSVHGADRESKHADRKPVCKDCHTNVSYRSELAPALRKVENKCMSCHDGFNDLDQSLRHMSLHLGADEYWHQKQNYETCVRCHKENELLPDSLQALLEDDMVTSFLRSFHGRGYQMGDRRSPVCSNCHGDHNILPMEDPASMIHPSNRQQTCSTMGCHEGASLAFATEGSMHDLYAGWKANLLVWIKRIYIMLIFGTIGGMLLHNLLELLAHRRHQAHLPKPPEGARKVKTGKVFLRMTRNERISHIVMFVCFTLLAITGGLLWLPVEYINPMGTVDRTLLLEIRAWSHRIAAVLMTLVSLYHIGYTLLTRRGRELLTGLLPRPRDIVQTWQQVLWLLGLRKDPVRFGFFNYGEKMEYWSFAWGTIVMSATGLILWAEHLGPKYIVDIARLVHSMEAILAVCAIVVWHFWNVHWKPGRWPMSEVWITGRIDREQMEEEHGAVLDFIETGEMPWACPVSNLVEEDQKPHNRKDDGIRKPVLRVLGYSMVALTMLSCLVMAWSFTKFLRGTENDPGPNRPNHDALVVKQDLRILPGDPSYTLAVAAEDPDWQHEHFHVPQSLLHVDEDLRRSECTLCHAGLAHTQDRSVRAALNMHSRYMACEVCHSPLEGMGESRVIWADLRRNPVGDPGTPYGLDRHPLQTQENFTSFLVLEQNGKSLFQDQGSERAKQYLAVRDELTPERKEAFTKDFHDTVAPLSERSLSCDDCHSREGWLDFRSLGFSEERVNQLETESKAASVTKYESFYLPLDH
ncbi:MAG: hypothetical protein KDC10_02000 [Calditrichaeota bacterium]|nr:hypothetical protein [Candidatus Cloacimonadota bacterium]MCB1045947.1 hypothetical protein [Calditrichota bacterium]